MAPFSDLKGLDRSKHYSGGAPKIILTSDRSANIKWVGIKLRPAVRNAGLQIWEHRLSWINYKHKIYLVFINHVGQLALRKMHQSNKFHLVSDWFRRQSEKKKNLDLHCLFQKGFTNVASFQSTHTQRWGMRPIFPVFVWCKANVTGYASRMSKAFLEKVNTSTVHCQQNVPSQPTELFKLSPFIEQLLEWMLIGAPQACSVIPFHYFASADRSNIK